MHQHFTKLRIGRAMRQAFGTNIQKNKSSNWEARETILDRRGGDDINKSAIASKTLGARSPAISVAGAAMTIRST